MNVTENMINEMIENLERELGEEHYYLCRTLDECHSEKALNLLWEAIEQSHFHVMQTYLRVVIGEEGINVLLNFFETEEEIHEIVCEETEFCLNTPLFDELYEYIPELVKWVEQTRKDLENENRSTEEAA